MSSPQLDRRCLTIVGASLVVAMMALPASAASTRGHLRVASSQASLSISVAPLPSGPMAGSLSFAVQAVSAMQSNDVRSPGRSSARWSKSLLTEFRYNPVFENRNTSALLLKVVVLAALIVGAVVLHRRHSEAWWITLGVGSVLLAFNLFLDVGNVGLSYNSPGLFGRSSAAPLFAYVEPSFAWPVLVHVALAGCLFAFAWFGGLTPKRRPLTFGVVLFVAALLGPASLGLSAPPRQVFHQFYFSGLDYIQHTRPLSASLTMLGEHVESMPQLSIHASTHGPAPILTLALFRAVVGNSVILLTAVVQMVGALLPLLTWWTARGFLEEGAARLAALLVVLTPSFQQFSFVSMDAVFAVVLYGTSALLVSCLFGKRRRGLPILLGAMVYVSALYTFSSAFLVPLGLFTAGLALYWGLVPPRRAVLAMLWSIGAFVAVLMVMRGVGFDLLACFRQAGQINSAMMGSAWRSPGHYLFSATGTIGAFAIGCGIPVTAMWLTALRRYHGDRSVASCLGAGALATILLLTLLGLYQWEVERIWLFLVPLVCLPAARYLHDIGKQAPRRMLAILIVLWLQTLFSELLLNTYW